MLHSRCDGFSLLQICSYQTGVKDVYGVCSNVNVTLAPNVDKGTAFYNEANQQEVRFSFTQMSWSGGLAKDSVALKAYSILAYGSPKGQAMTRITPYVPPLSCQY